MKKFVKLFTIVLVSLVFLLSTVNAIAATFTYDAQGRLVEISHESGKTITFVYDANGNMTAVTIDAVPDGMFSATVISEYAEYVQGSGNYEPGAIVTIFAGIRHGYIFRGWTASPHVDFSGEYAFNSFIMPDTSVTVTANWEEVEAKLGDVNGDGYVNNADHEMLSRFIRVTHRPTFMAANPVFIYENANLNGDNEVNATDLTLLRLFIAANPTADALESEECETEIHANFYE